MKDCPLDFVVFVFIDMDKQIVRIPSRLYFDLFSIGGDKMLAVFAILKANSDNSRYYAYKGRNNKITSKYGLLRAKTNISLSVLEKYVPQLIELHLCKFDEQGNFIMKGAKLLRESYNYKFKEGKKVYDNSVKMIPLVIGETFIETSYNMASPRFHSLKDKQEKQINSKKKLCELQSQGANTTNITKYKAYKSALRKGKFDNLHLTENVVLSNQGYAKLKDNSIDNKSKGEYWKQVYIKKGLVKSERNFEKVQKMSFAEYQIFKKLNDFNPKLTYFQGYLVISLVSSLLVNSLT